MPERFALVDPLGLLGVERSGGITLRDLGGALGAQGLAACVWQLPPGRELPDHRHHAQEVLYALLSGGPQEILLEGEVLLVRDGEWLRLAGEAARRIQNRSDREAVWLAIEVPRDDGPRGAAATGPAPARGPGAG
jgi:uncharacterized cupin superfamily protein